MAACKDSFQVKDDSKLKADSVSANFSSESYEALCFQNIRGGVYCGYIWVHARILYVFQTYVSHTLVMASHDNTFQTRLKVAYMASGASRLSANSTKHPPDSNPPSAPSRSSRLGVTFFDRVVT